MEEESQGENGGKTASTAPDRSFSKGILHSGNGKHNSERKEKGRPGGGR